MASHAHRRCAGAPAPEAPAPANGIRACPCPPAPAWTAAASCSAPPGGCVSVYGARRLGLTDQRARRRHRPGGRDARARRVRSWSRSSCRAAWTRCRCWPRSSDPLYRKLRPSLAVAPGSGLPVHRGPAAGLAPGGRLRWPALHDAGKVTVFPGIGYTSPDMSHFTSRHYWEVGGDRARRSAPAGWGATWTRRQRRQSAAGPVDGRADEPGAGHGAQPGGGDRPPGGLLALARRRLGQRVQLDARLRRGLGDRSSAAPAIPPWPRSPRRRRRSASCARRWRRSATRTATPPTAARSPIRPPRQSDLPQRLAGLAAMIAGGLPAALRGADHRHSVRHPLRPGGDLHSRPDADRRLDRRLPGRPRGARASPIACSCTCGRSSAAARRRTARAGPTTAPPGPRC